ncbi:hypothetical protein BU16DRAFT_620161 [Lophium mytilinum]|uniref:Uncharacterized protein n=1 Tax=Lophium mytilinum TaxID=390894 RepID=A0A6A6QM80_9PEZI|nr:hypothetical protein BU16DRAFT_620161 [Lophium mytilinum]
MFSAKRSFIEDYCEDRRPAKRQVPTIAYDISSAQFIQDVPPAYINNNTSSEPSLNALPWPLVDFDNAESCTLLPSIPGPADEVCFGMICGLKTQFLDDPSIASLHSDADVSKSNYFQLQIAMKRIHMLQTNNGTDIAILKTQTSKALQELDHRSTVRYTVYVATAEWATKIRSFMTLGKSVCLDIDIYFFGPRSNSTDVGRILSDAGLFLQAPDFLDSSIPYDNPHEISFASISNFGSQMSAPIPESSSVGDLSVDIVSTVLANLDHMGDLVNLDVDMTAITTVLKPHQREALDFIAHRESPHISERFSLFKQCVDSRNRKYYENAVVGCRKPQRPPEDFGGIIADEMGLGKTLTMISAIATTLDRARRFSNEDLCRREVVGPIKRTKATLVICPAVLLIDGWMEEVSKHVAPRLLKCTKYHGTSKATESEILDSDIVLTTYATLIADSTRNSNLHGIHWFRVIIDEAHSIRHQQTKQFRAVVALSARYRWCLTGTPIQNVLNDLGALVRFLRVPHLDRPSDFYSHIAGPVEKHNAAGFQRLRDLLQCICIRRTKDLLNLAEHDSRIELVQLTEEERSQYCRIGESHRQAIDRAIERRNLTDASSGLFRAIMQLRTFCNSGLCVNPEQADSPKDESFSLLEQDYQAVCSYCSCDVSSVGDQESASSGVILHCSHLLCQECLCRAEKIHKSRIRCVVCGTICASPRGEQQQLPKSDDAPSNLKSYSSKLEALVHNIMHHQEEKCIVFSSWKTSIKLAASYLTAYNIPVCVVDGSMTLPDRRSQILRFQQDPTIPALLMTLGTGAVGLNLTVANRVHILEPQWNPSVEKQAIERVMRLGQEKKVTIVRYLDEHTVEQFIQTKQEKKLYLAQLGWDGSKTESEDDQFRNVIDMKSLLSM